jgi:hypothetical protein
MEMGLCRKGEAAMFRIQRLAWPLLAGIAAVLLLGQLPGLERGMQERRQTLAVLRPERLTTISDESLVSALSGLPLRERLRRAGWDHAIVSVDLAVQDERTTPAVIWRDIQSLIRLSFADADNVGQLLVRVFREDGSGRSLLFAADSRKADWAKTQLLQALQPDATTLRDWQAKLRLVETPNGRRWLRNISK